MERSDKGIISWLHPNDHHLISGSRLPFSVMELQNRKPKAHVAMFPSPGMGHLIPFVEFAKRLALFHDFSITFILTKWDVSSAQTAYTQSLASSPLDIRFVELPEVDVDSEADENVKIETIVSKLLEKYRGSVEEALKSLLSSCSPICAFVTDMFCTAALGVGLHLGIPSYILFTSSASTLALMLHLPKLVSEIQISFKDMDSAVEVPGLPPIPARDLPTPLQDRTNDAFRWFVHHSSLLREAEGILINTFHDLERQSVAALVDGKILSRDEMPKIYTVGPLISSPVSESEKVKDEEKAECLKWLDRQPDSSVLFVSFGSGGALSVAQTEELALGLEASRQRFLWVVRRPLSPTPADNFSRLQGSEISDLLPRGFESRTKDRGLVVASWAPQIPILSHPSTGGFLSHCGWNSTLESISFGVPIIAWPLFAEQRLNGFFLVNEIKTAIEAKAGADEIVRKEEVERVAKELMEGEEGIQVRSRAKELKESAKRALAEGGSSSRSLAAAATVWKNISSEATRPHSGQSSMTLQSMD